VSRDVHPALAPEAQLLLLSAALVPDARRVRAVAERTLDWNFLVQLAVHQKAVQVLWRGLESHAAEFVPDVTRASVQGLRMVADFRTAMLRQRMNEALRTLADAGIPTMVLKGGALGLTVYPAFEDRPMGDIDLLVPSDRLAEAQRALLGAGWTGDREGDHAAFYAEHHHLPPLLDPHGSGIAVEVHSQLFAPGHPFRLPDDELWARSGEVVAGTAQARVPEPHDAMIHLCVHFVWSHGASSGAWRTFRDVDALIRSGRLDPERLRERAVSTMSGTCVYWTLRLARNLGGVDVPSAWIESFRPRGSTYLLASIEHHLATSLLPSRQSCPSRTLTRWMWEAAVQPRRSGHGAARPWAHDRLVRETFLRGRAPSAWTRIRIQLQALRGWARYLSAVMRPGSSRLTI
jgi:hypothetical protein